MAQEIKENLYFLRKPGFTLTLFSTGINTLYAISHGNFKEVTLELYDNEHSKVIDSQTIKLDDLTEDSIVEMEKKANYYC